MSKDKEHRRDTNLQTDRSVTMAIKWAGHSHFVDLVLLAAYVDHVVAHPAADHRHAPRQGVVGRGQLIRPDGGHRGPGPIIGQ